MSEEQTFKLVMRGYERSAVDAFIETLKNDHEQEINTLKAELTSLRAEKEEMQTQLEEGEKLRSEMQTAMAGAQEFINAQAAKLKATERDVEDLKKKNALYLDKQEALTRLLADAQVKCATLVEEAQQHADRIAAEAEKKSAEILEKATANAAAIIAESKRDADAVQTALRKRFSTITDTVAAIRQLNAQVSSCCDAADQMIAEPDSFFYEDTTAQ
ncbi:MAG: DivIVA domain-containing protein [Angelakisella sp.]